LKVLKVLEDMADRVMAEKKKEMKL